MRSEGYSSCFVCMCVCLSVGAAHAILAERAIKSIMKDTIVLNIRFAAIFIKWRFSFKIGVSPVHNTSHSYAARRRAPRPCSQCLVLSGSERDVRPTAPLKRALVMYYMPI